MKASIRLRQDQQHHHNQTLNQIATQNQQQNPLVRAKIPISILGFPFISIISAGDPSDLSFSLRTNSHNGPSLKFSYSPNSTTTPQNNNTSPFSLSLKSGVGLFGSPQNSPLIMSANFNLFGNPNPTFLLQIKPQFGDFSLKKMAVSTPLPNPNPNPPTNFSKENGGTHFAADDIGVMLERPLAWRELTEFRNGGDGFLSGLAVTAKTVLPITKQAVVKFRWGVNFPPDFDQKLKLPFLTVDKIAVERVEEKMKSNSMKKEQNGIVGEDLEMLKGMCFWMKKEVEGLQRENRTLKESLEGLNLGSPIAKGGRGSSGNADTKSISSSPSSDNSTDFERWRNKRNSGEENGKSEMKKVNGSESSNNNAEEELKRAIMAASSK